MFPSPRHALVLGLGRSGAGAARLLLGEGRRVTVVESREGDAIHAARLELEAAGASVRTGVGELPAGDFDLAVVSPGISEHSDWVSRLRARGVPVLSELELGWSRARARVLAVTGSLGKSTAATWCRQALAANGYRAALAGNIGISVCDFVREHNHFDWLVLEVSSFQLETVRHFRADVGLLLNVLPNHLDRHGDFDTYLALKARLFARSRESDTVVLPLDHQGAVRRLGVGAGRVTLFGPGPEAAWRYDRHAVWHQEEPVVPLARTLFDNPVLGLNAAGVAAALTACGVAPSAIAASARALRPLPHRMQEVRVRAGVRFVDDSKATCLAAVEAALRMLPGRKHLLAGGVLKERDLAGLRPTLSREVAAAYLIGQGAPALAEAWSPVVPCQVFPDLDHALAAAQAAARPGESVLLSPGGASFDQFRDFEHRGRHFQERVLALPEPAGNSIAIPPSHA
jgi:UDP-N-acetylmuramoylalanine--D-glutamate ligase